MEHVGMPPYSLLRAVTAVSLAVTAAPLAAQQRDTTARDTALLEPVVVTAERRPTVASAATSLVRVVDRLAITRRAAIDLTTLLRDIPGVQIDPVVGSGAGVMLQGMTSDRVLVLVDGAPLAGRIGGELDLSRLDPQQFERIEVVDGPQSTLYGSGALGGVVNLLTRRDLANRAEVTLNAGEFGQLDGRARVSGLLGGVGGSLELGRRAVDLAAGASPATVGFSKRWDGLTRLATGATNVRVLGVVENQMYRTGTTAAPRYNLNDNWQWDVLSETKLEQLELRVHASTYDHRLTPSTTLDVSGGRAEWDKQRVADVEALRYGTFGRHAWLAGAKAEYEWLYSRRIDGSRRSGVNGAAYTSFDWMLSGLAQLTTGARVSANEKWGVDVAPRIAVIVRPTRALTVKAGLARGYRAPGFKEQYMDFLNTFPGGGYVVRGDPDLKPEESWNATAEAAVRSGPVYLYTRGFSNQLRNFIQTQRRLPDSSTIQIFYYENVQRAWTHGMEVGGALGQGIAELSGSIAFLETEDKTTGTELLGRAKLSGRGALTVSPGRFSFRSEVHRQGRVPISRTATATTYQAALTRLNFSGTASVGELRLVAGVDNVFDDIPENALMQTGRRWYLSLTTGISL
jgi:outer membrane receptor for ferrienterochelin and colicins